MGEIKETATAIDRCYKCGETKELRLMYGETNGAMSSPFLIHFSIIQDAIVGEQYK